jgi:hypothetical protein
VSALPESTAAVPVRPQVLAVGVRHRHEHAVAGDEAAVVGHLLAADMTSARACHLMTTRDLTPAGRRPTLLFPGHALSRQSSRSSVWAELRARRGRSLRRSWTLWADDRNGDRVIVDDRRAYIGIWVLLLASASALLTAISGAEPPVCWARPARRQSRKKGVASPLELGRADRRPQSRTCGSGIAAARLFRNRRRRATRRNRRAARGVRGTPAPSS